MLYNLFLIHPFSHTLLSATLCHKTLIATIQNSCHHAHFSICATQLQLHTYSPCLWHLYDHDLWNNVRRLVSHTPVMVSSLLSDAFSQKVKSRRLTASDLAHFGSHRWSWATWQKLITLYGRDSIEMQQADMHFIWECVSLSDRSSWQGLKLAWKLQTQSELQELKLINAEYSLLKMISFYNLHLK